METPERWKRPRVGQKVKLRSGQVVEVVSVRRCNDVLRMKTEDEAMVLGANLRATYGKHWQSIYYEADAVVRGRLITFGPNDVEEVLDTRL